LQFNYCILEKKKVNEDLGSNGQEEPLIVKNKLNYEDEKLLEQNFVDQLIEELRKVNYFFNENLKHYRKYLESIEVIQ